MSAPVVPDDTAPRTAEREAFAVLEQELATAVDLVARAGLHLEEVPAPRRLAPFAAAWGARVERHGEDVATGRFVVLHDPAGQDGWRGTVRVVAFVSADVEPEMASDAALAQVGWSWLVDALDERGARRTAEGGTVTRTTSVRFGSIAEPEESNEVEIRASWTPVADDSGVWDLGRHLTAWCDLLGATAGLPPPGVTELRAR